MPMELIDQVNERMEKTKGSGITTVESVILDKVVTLSYDKCP